MTASSPSPETIRFIARILGARPTAVTEVAETIANIARTVDQLTADPVALLPTAVPAKTRTAKVAAPRSTVTEAAPVPEAIILKPRGERAAANRPRRRIVQETAIDEPEIEVAPVPAPQPRLLRRAEIAHPEQDAAAALQQSRPTDGLVRGVVKWFDGKTGKGALRLTGVSGDVALERGVLEQSAIKRLYKDQEIEATIQDLGRGRVTLLSLSLPGRNPAAVPSGGLFGGATAGTTNAHRQARSVMVEVKRDGIRATSAREEAEHVLGGVERLRNTRSMTPSK